MEAVGSVVHPAAGGKAGVGKFAMACMSAVSRLLCGRDILGSGPVGQEAGQPDDGRGSRGGAAKKAAAADPGALPVGFHRV